jgi:arginase family enzyme
MNIDHVARVARGVAARVERAMADGHVAIVLGGDCTVELGTVAGALAGGAGVGVVYVDLDTDLNPPAESDGALDWTGVAHLLAVPGAAPQLAGLAARTPMLTPSDVLFFGVNNTGAAQDGAAAHPGVAGLASDHHRRGEPRPRTRRGRELRGAHRRAVHGDPEAERVRPVPDERRPGADARRFRAGPVRRALR